MKIYKEMSKFKLYERKKANLKIIERLHEENKQIDLRMDQVEHENQNQLTIDQVLKEV